MQRSFFFTPFIVLNENLKKVFFFLYVSEFFNSKSKKPNKVTVCFVNSIALGNCRLKTNRLRGEFGEEKGSRDQ